MVWVCVHVCGFPMLPPPPMSSSSCTAAQYDGGREGEARGETAAEVGTCPETNTAERERERERERELKRKRERARERES